MLSRMKETIRYAMSSDGKHFYKINMTYQTYTMIPEQQFFKESLYKKSDLQQLAKSVYPTQGNDYLLLKKEGQLFPVDYKLAPFVQYLWSQGIRTSGWNQPDDFNTGFVSMDHSYLVKDEYSKNQTMSSLAFLESLMKQLGLPFKVLYSYNKELTAQSLDRAQKYQNNLLKKGYIVLDFAVNYVSISFNEEMMEKLYKKLGLELNEKRKPGGGIIWGPSLKEYKKT